MRFFTALTAVALSSTLLFGCKSMSTEGLIHSGTTAMEGATLTDEEVISMADKSCAQMDAKAKIASPDSVYSKRLARIADNLGDEVDGTSIDYKVYLADVPNAFAMANGCVRVYSGLMDMMNDNEVTAVLGHELGHVALGHVKSSMQTAYAAYAARSALASSSNDKVAALSKSQLGDLGEKFINAQFSQSQEAAADNFSFDLLGERGISRKGQITGLEKLASLDGNAGGLLSTHPASAERAENMRERLNEEK